MLRNYLDRAGSITHFCNLREGSVMPYNFYKSPVYEKVLKLRD